MKVIKGLWLELMEIIKDEGTSLGTSNYIYCPLLYSQLFLCVIKAFSSSFVCARYLQKIPCLLKKQIKRKPTRAHKKALRTKNLIRDLQN